MADEFPHTTHSIPKPLNKIDYEPTQVPTGRLIVPTFHIAKAEFFLS